MLVNSDDRAITGQHYDDVSNVLELTNDRGSIYRGFLSSTGNKYINGTAGHGTPSGYNFSMAYIPTQVT